MFCTVFLSFFWRCFAACFRGLAKLIKWSLALVSATGGCMTKSRSYLQDGFPGSESDIDRLSSINMHVATWGNLTLGSLLGAYHVLKAQRTKFLLRSSKPSMHLFQKSTTMTHPKSSLHAQAGNSSLARTKGKSILDAVSRANIFVVTDEPGNHTR